jgi:AraC family transcriptional regulator
VSTPHPFPLRAEETPVLGGCATVRMAYESPLVSLFTYRCLCDGEELRSERVHLQPALALSFVGASRLCAGSRRLQLDPASALWHQAGQSYRPSHPWGCGCRGCYLRVDVALADELSRPSRASSLRGFCITPATQLAVRRLLAALWQGTLCEPLAIEETLLRILAEVLAVPHEDGAAQRGATQEVHDRCVERAQAHLQERFRERVRLDQLARVACASPDHLTRIFRRQTGLTLYHYLLRLRLPAALDALSVGVADLTGLALDLGFASHSHFTLAFRQRFGATPATVRDELAGRSRIRAAHDRGPDAEWCRDPTIG